MKLHPLTLALGLAAWSALAAAAGSTDPDRRAADIEQQMTDAERFHLLHSHLPLTIEAGKPSQLIPGVPIVPGYVRGIARLGIPDIVESDASLGVVNPFELREGDVATALPSSLALAASFDPALAYRAGAMIGGEAKAKGFNVLLAPGVNLTRDPRNGRNFEYMGEDPLLAGVLGGEASRGIQSTGVVATIKHFALNAQESLRMSLDARIDEAALRESDLLAFEIGIERGQPGSVMCAYNRLNGPYACGSDFLLNQVLKRDWGYKGWVMSDWGAVHEVGYFNAGLDQHSGAELDKKVWFDAPLQVEYAAGRVSKERLSDAVRRILRSIYAVGADVPTTKKDIDYAANGKVAQEVESSGIVLLKNDGVLPLANAPQSIVVIGGYAVAGVMSGGGSSQVTPVGGVAAIIPNDVHRLVKRPVGQALIPSSPVAALKAALPDAKITSDSGYDIPMSVAKAARADLAIVVATKWQSEGWDAGDMSLPGGQDELIAAVAKANPRTVVVLQTGNPVLMPWLTQVKAVVEAWYPGQKGGEAIAAILSGAVNPSGRLPMSFPASEQQTPRPVLPGFGLPEGTALAVDYPEGADVGYRWFAAKGQRPLFAFGHGLSYTSFERDGLSLRGGDSVTASFTVRNTGKRDGAEVAQLYLVKAGGRPLQRLAGFERVGLKPGESRKVTVKVDARLLADWKDGGWQIAGGDYAFALGASAAELGQPVSVRLAARRLKP
ncbi:MAG: beta-glucosidase [Solimonas sp.]